MKKIEIILICLLLCLICSIQALSAADVANSTDNIQTTQDIEVVKSSNVSDISLSNADNQILSEGEGTFSDLHNDILNGELTRNYVFDSGSDSGLTNGIVISTDMTIDGKGNVVIDAANQARVFNIASGATVVLKGITFINANADGDGGSILADGKVTIIDCNFLNSNAQGSGGAVAFATSESYVENTKFINNTADVNGGAVFIKSTDGNNNDHTGFDKCTFINNTAGRNGGAVDWSAGATNGYIKNSIFTNNTAQRSGGAVYWKGHYGTISNTNFTHNNATGKVIDGIGGGDGGAVLWIGSHCIINNNCYFNDNYAAYRGGAIFLHGDETENCTNTTVDSCVFKYNVAGINGGAIDWQKGAHDGMLSNSLFINNTAYRSGGAVFWFGTNGAIKDSNFTNNTALGIVNYTDSYGNITYGGYGGAVMWTGSTGDVINSRFIGNEAKYNSATNSGGRGGAVYLQGSSLGGCSNTAFNTCTFISNIAGTNGGAIDWHEGAHDGLVEYCIFINNTAKRSAGAVFWNGHNGTIKYSRFYGNKALGIVLASTVHGESTGEVSYGGDGGAVMWSGSLGEVMFCNFVNNTAAKRGGAVFLQGSDIEKKCENTSFKYSYFANNIAGSNGGAIGWNNEAVNALVDNVTFINNTAGYNGGAIFWNGENGTVKNSRFTNNRATGVYRLLDIDVTYENIIVVNKNEDEFLSVGPTSADMNKLYALNYTDENNNTIRIFKLYAADDSTGTLKWVKLDETTVNIQTISPKDWAIDQFFGGDGGTILWSGDIGLIYNCNFTDSNSARRGGGAYMTGSDYVTYDHCNFINCTSGTNGGGVDWLAGANYGKIYNCVFNGTRAARSAGAIYYDGWYGEMINVTIINIKAYGGSIKTSDDGLVKYAGWDSSHWDTNNTGGDAGAIMFTGNHEYLYNVTFINCTSQGRGGAVFLQDNQNVTFDLCRFIECEALGIATNTWNDYTKERDDSNNDTKIDYKLTGHGGAIAFDVGAHDAVIKNSEFTFNYARRDGGAINIAKNAFNASVENCKFTNNSCGDDGGAINWEGDLGIVKNITCYNNTGRAYADPVTGASTSKGGTICLTGDNVTITKSSFKLGTVLYNNGKLNETDAGAIFLTGNHAVVSHNIFDTCWAPNYAGAIQIIGNDTVVNNCTFINCNATEDGGALYVTGVNCHISNSTFTNNLAGDDGGAIYWKGNLGGIYNVTCTNNRGISLGDSTSTGGSISIIGDNVTVDKSYFTLSSATYSGGAIFVSGSNVNITRSDFLMCNVSHNVADAHKDYLNGGGSIYVMGNSTNIINCTFDRTNAKEGGVMYIQGNNAAIINVTAVRSFALNGGSIYVKGANALIIHSDISMGNATKDGGSIYIEGFNATITDSSLRMCTADNDGGTVYISGDSATIKNTKFLMTMATRNGGSVYIKGVNAEILNSNFTQSRSQSGGVIYVDGDNTTINKISSSMTSVSLNGASIYVKGNNAIIENPISIKIMLL